MNKKLSNNTEIIFSFGHIIYLTVILMFYTLNIANDRPLAPNCVNEFYRTKYANQLLKHASSRREPFIDLSELVTNLPDLDLKPLFYYDFDRIVGGRPLIKIDKTPYYNLFISNIPFELEANPGGGSIQFQYKISKISELPAFYLNFNALNEAVKNDFLSTLPPNLSNIVFNEGFDTPLFNENITLLSNTLNDYLNHNQ